jgi:hypothetical protein
LEQILRVIHYGRVIFPHSSMALAGDRLNFDPALDKTFSELFRLFERPKGEPYAPAIRFIQKLVLFWRL